MNLPTIAHLSNVPTTHSSFREEAALLIWQITNTYHNKWQQKTKTLYLFNVNVPDQRFDFVYNVLNLLQFLYI